MKKTDIERILKQGSIKQKIKLYMTDIAYYHIIGEKSIGFELYSIPKIFKVRDELLTDKEREILINSIKNDIKEPKDIEYYNNLKDNNNAFLIFKDKFSIDLMKLHNLFYLISISNGKDIKRLQNKELVNEILDLIPDKKIREKALNKAIEVTKGEGGIKLIVKGYRNYLEIDRSMFWDEIKRPTEKAILIAKGCKEYLITFKEFLANDLPLKPYKDWLEIQEKKLIRLITAIHQITILESTPTDFPKIELYDEIKAEVTDEDIEDFKNAGI
jgi:hypothetical protein